jgi:sec-independent protein translocase protein TatA
MPCGRLGTSELLLIGLLIVLLFGAGRLPEVGRGLGLGIRRFKKALRDEDDEEGTPKRVVKHDSKES